MCALYIYVHGRYQQNAIHLGVCSAGNYTSETTEKVENWQLFPWSSYRCPYIQLVIESIVEESIDPLVLCLIRAWLIGIEA